ncbi:hypothetical protein Sjap_020899 [Stephania japonica]|uniref:Mediator complex subunit Med12 domain-containing protein n=1 Tax=Stephania japonica TaxID=461633 RepID=A0AAP0F1L1_9MAGN
MQRYPASSCGVGVSNIASGGTAPRDTTKSDSSFHSSNFSSNSRRLSQVSPYKLICDREPLNARLGPPDYYPQTPNCPEETLTREYVLQGYKETVDGLEEAREITLTQLVAFTKPIVLKCKEAIRKRLRAINESRARKRKAGQVYGVPLSGSLLTKPSVFPEQKQGLSQQHKSLRLLAEQVPHGYRRRALFEVLIRQNVPLLRATWFIKVTYLNQFRQYTASVSSSAQEKPQLIRSDCWTKDVTEYLHILLEEFLSKDGSLSAQGKDQASQMLFTGLTQYKGDSPSALVDAEEPSWHFKWLYTVRILHSHLAEGLIIPSLLIEWVFRQLQEKESIEILLLLLPIIFGVIETLVQSQSYVRTLVEIAVRCIQESLPGRSDLVDNSRRAYVVSALVEMIRYLILAVPDTFVALDCFPLPPCVLSEIVQGRSFLLKLSEDCGKVQYGPRDYGVKYADGRSDDHCKVLSLDYLVSSIQKRADNLAKAVSPGPQGHGVAKAVQALDKALITGDVREAYTFLFNDLFDQYVEERWIAEVSACLQASLKWIDMISLSLVCSVFFLCEWATCDFRDFRSSIPPKLKFSGRKDFSEVYLAVQILKLQMEVNCNSVHGKSNISLRSGISTKGAGQFDSLSGGTTVDHSTPNKNKPKIQQGIIGPREILRSPGPVHDILVCWIDQHEAGKGEGFKRLQLLIVELIRAGIFFPLAYVRQLMVSGIMDRNETPMDLEKWKRHYQILKMLPGSYLFDALKEAQIAAEPVLQEAVRVFSNERRLLLHELSGVRFENGNSTHGVSLQTKGNPTSGRSGASSVSLDKWKNVLSSSGSLSARSAKSKLKVADLKTAISIALNFPDSCSALSDLQADDCVGTKRPIGLVLSKTDMMEGTDGCEECNRAKRQKLSEERSLFQQVCSSNQSDCEDPWWVRKGPKMQESFKVDPPLKPAKSASRNRQKIVRKTQSLAQLASARIEGSQGASTSHLCDNKISCSHHRSSMEGELPKSIDGIRTTQSGDIVKIGKSLKQLRLLEKRTITGWLITSVMQLVEGSEKIVPHSAQDSGSFTCVEERNSLPWKLGEDELSAILYMMDVASDLVSAIKFSLWLLPRIPNNQNPTYSGRNILMTVKSNENYACDVGEAFIVSSIQRYENILIAADLLPEALSVAMHRAATVLGSSGRASTSAAFTYARNLLKKYANVTSVVKWEKSFKATCDPRLLSELESGRSLDGEFGFAHGVPAGVDDLDGYYRQKIVGRLSRAGPSMKEIIQRHIDDAVNSFFGKERKLMAAGTPRSTGMEKWDDIHQRAQQIVFALIDCIRQNSPAGQEGDPSLIASAISAIVGSICLAVAKLPDFTSNSNYPKFPSPISSLNCARRIVRIHISCLCLLKEALGERHCRVFEIALAEAAAGISGTFAPGKASRSQFSEAHDSNSNLSNEILNNSAKVILARATKAAAAVSALVIGAVVQGVTSLERMVTVFRLKENLDIRHFIRNPRASSNGISRSIGAIKIDSSIEVYLHWFRLLVGNPRTVSDGLVVELVGEPCMLAFARMQRMLPFSLVFPPAYTIFSLVIWRPYIVNGSIVNREDIQVYQYLALAVDCAIRHQPFRDVCLGDTRVLYDSLASDVGDTEFASYLESHGLDKHLKTPFVPLRARLFLNALLDCKMPDSTPAQTDGPRASGHGDSKVMHAENEKKLVDQLVHGLDTMQPAKFHWQWVELRLLLNEQVLIEKIGAPCSMSLTESIQSLFPSADNGTCSENDKNFSEMLLTRLLVRPDAAPLYSEVVHLLGRSQEESILLLAKWFLGGPDVLYGRKSIRQRLVNIAYSRGLSTKAQFWKPWGWSSAASDSTVNKLEKKVEASSIEEGEVVEEGLDSKRSGKVTSQMSDIEGYMSNQQCVTEKALAELILPCMDRSSSDSRNNFASELIKQMNNIGQQISSLAGGASKQVGAVAIGVENTVNKVNSRKGIRGGSPGLGRRSTAAAATDSAPPSTVALRASMRLRLQFLLRLLPIIYADSRRSRQEVGVVAGSEKLPFKTHRNFVGDMPEPHLKSLTGRLRLRFGVGVDNVDGVENEALLGEPSDRNLRSMLASVILRLLGNRVLHEDADLSSHAIPSPTTEGDSSKAVHAASLENSGESLFDQFLSVLYGLLSSYKPSWLKLKTGSKSTVKSPRDHSQFDPEILDNFQNELDRMQLPDAIRWRIQAAMPVPPRFNTSTISCQPPAISAAALASLQTNASAPAVHLGNSNPTQKNLSSLVRCNSNTSGKSKTTPLQDQEMEIDPWTVLEDGTASAPSSSNVNMSVGGEATNVKACHWLKGAVRVRRTDLTYIGAMDEDN